MHFIDAIEPAQSRHERSEAAAGPEQAGAGDLVVALCFDARPARLLGEVLGVEQLEQGREAGAVAAVLSVARGLRRPHHRDCAFELDLGSQHGV